MLFRLNILLAVVLVILSCSCFTAETDANVPANTAVKSTQVKPPAFPYVAEITGTDVYIRSGPGTAYYFCRKANAPEKVTVVEHLHTWAKILPPEGSFSWISKNYVKLDPVNSKVGIVTGDGVRVWAGSDYEVPMRSSSLQTKLDKEATIWLTSVQPKEGDYYKIIPPPAAYLWVNTQYLKYVGPVPKPDLKKPTKTKVEPKQEVKQVKTETPKVTKPVVKVEKKTQEPVVKPQDLSIEAKLIEQCRQLGEQIDAELAKPLDKQNYDTIKKPLKKIAEDKGAGRAILYAEYELDRINRFELARTVGKELKQQDAQLSKTLQKIKKKRDAALADQPKTGKYIASGTLKLSQVYTSQTGQKRYIIINETGKIDCYAIAADIETDVAAQKLIKHKVGLLGKITATPKSPVSIIEFTKVVDLDDK